MKVVLHHDAGPAVIALLDQHRSPDLELTWCAVEDRDGLARQLADADVLLHVLDPVTDAVLAQAPRLRLVQKLGVGVNTIDLDAARRRGIAVANMPGVNSQAAAEHTLLLMLAVLRRVVPYHEATRAGRGWSVDPALTDGLGEIGGRTVGLIGYGAIAQRVEQFLLALGATVVHTSRRMDRPGWLPLPELLAASDIVSLHLPLTDETRKLVDADRLALLRRGAIVVNTARGAIVDQGALVEALATAHLAGAGLDVFADEPIAPDDPILDLDNVVLTPHLAWLTVETMARCLTVAAENCRRLAHGEALLHQVV